MNRTSLLLGSLGILITAAVSSRAVPSSPTLQPQENYFASELPELSGAWVMLYDDEDFVDRVLTVRGGTNINNFDKVHTDDGKKGFEDKPTSVRWNIPKGWTCVLFEDKNCKGQAYRLVGTGTTQEDPNLGDFGDEVSSLRWERS